MLDCTASPSCSLTVWHGLVPAPPHPTPAPCHACAAARTPQVDDTDVINFLLSTEIIPLCLRTMEMGSELSKTVATFIVQKILLDDVRAAGRRQHGHARMGSARRQHARMRRVLRHDLAQCSAAAARLLASPRLPHLRQPTAPNRSQPPATRPPRAASTTTQVGLNYICATAERFFAVGAVLGNMVVLLAEQPSPRLLKHIIRCYLRLSDNPR